MKNVVLTGFMGTGKTAVARELSKLLGMKIVDMDTEIEKQQGITINEIFAQYGEPRFREIEAEMARKISGLSGAIISTGGGVVLRAENIENLRKNGFVICLTASPETILKRTGSSDDRPLLKVDDPLKRIGEMLEYRMPFYQNADIMINTENKTPLQIAEEIVERLQWKR
jgi:shikimate kinase